MSDKKIFKVEWASVFGNSYVLAESVEEAKTLEVQGKDVHYETDDVNGGEETVSDIYEVNFIPEDYENEIKKEWEEKNGTK